MAVLPIPASLTNTTWVAPGGSYTLPVAKVACHGVVTVDLSACSITDGGGNAGLLNVATDCSALTLLGGTYTTVSNAVFVGMSDTANAVVTINGFTSTGMTKLLSGQKVNPASIVYVRNSHCTGLSVGIEGLLSIDVDACTLNGGGANNSPMGLHIFQDAAKALLWVPGLHLRCTNSTVTGYISSATAGFRQGDAILCESTCESVFIDNCLLGHNSDSGGLDCKANWGQISNCTIESDGGRAISNHTMGNGTGPWNGIRSINNIIHVNNGTIPLSGGFTEAFQAEGILESFNDQVTLAPGARLAVCSWQDTQGSGALGSYPRLGTITLHDVHDASGTPINSPIVPDGDATHHPTITVLNGASPVLLQANSTSVVSTTLNMTGLKHGTFNSTSTVTGAVSIGVAADVPVLLPSTDAVTTVSVSSNLQRVVRMGNSGLTLVQDLMDFTLIEGPGHSAIMSDVVITMTVDAQFNVVSSTVKVLPHYSPPNPSLYGTVTGTPVPRAGELPIGFETT